MKKLFIFFACALLTFCFFSSAALSQSRDEELKVACDDCKDYRIDKNRDNGITLISCESAVKYVNNYRRKFRKSENRRAIHPQFVNFSKKTLLDINDFFKKDTRKEYRGIDFYFSLLSKKPSEEIQIFLTPEQKDRTADFKAFDILSSKSDYNNISLHPVDAYRYKENYEDLYYSKKKHTRSIFLDTSNFKFMGRFFEDASYKNYLGVKVYFASYNKYLKKGDKKIENGQVRRKQITLVLIPVNASGNPDFCAFGKFWKEYRKFDDSGLNHGTLCPTQCPGGDD
jgi:hypothetical protein